MMEAKQTHRHDGQGYQLMMEQCKDNLFLMVDAGCSRHLLKLTGKECPPHFSGTRQLFEHLQNPGNHRFDWPSSQLVIGAPAGVGGQFQESASFTLKEVKSHQASEQTLSRSIEEQV